MAFATRGDADRDALIHYVETEEVPAAWREGSLKITLGGDTVIRPEVAPAKPRNSKRS